MVDDGHRHDNPYAPPLAPCPPPNRRYEPPVQLSPLVELLVVFAIVAMLVGLLLPEL